jgi:hypothetical protein
MKWLAQMIRLDQMIAKNSFESKPGVRKMGRPIWK